MKSRSSIPMPLTVHVDGRDWHLFDVQYQTADGPFSTYIYAISSEHAEAIVLELRETARVGGQVCGVYDA